MRQMETALDRDAGASVTTEAPFDDFFLAERDRLYRAMWLVARDGHEAEELTQDAFLRLWERWDKVAAMDDPTGYLFRTAMRLYLNRRRRAALALRRTVGRERPHDGLDAVDQRDAVVRALGVLTPAERAAIVLTGLVDLSSEEAARALHVRPSTVRVLASRARSKLRDELGGDDA